MQTKHFYEFGPFRLDPEERLLSRDSQHVPLPPKVIETLLALVESRGHLVDKDALMKRVWPDAFVEEGNLNKNVFLLRKTLGQWDGGLEYIETVPRRGYRFVAPVNQVAGGLIESRPNLAMDRTADSAKAELLPQSHLRRLLMLIGLILAASLAGVLTWRTWHVRSTNTIRSLAVLPLENLSGDAAQDYFADGMTDELITDLGKIGSIRVISRTSIMKYKGVHKPLPQIARELDVDGIVEGTVFRSGDRVRITAQLIQARVDKHLWAESYQVETRNALSLQNEVASAIARQIRITLTPQQKAALDESRAVSPEAYESYWKGEYFLDKATPDSVRKAAECFQDAITKQPDYVTAYDKLAASYQILGALGALSKEVSQSKAKVAIEKALALDSLSGTPHALKGWDALLNELDISTAGAEFRRAAELSPNGVEGHQGLSEYDAVVGQMEQAVREAERAREIDPLSVIVNINLCRMLYFARRFDEALAQCRANLALDPNLPRSLRYIGAIYAAKGMDSEAAVLFLQVHEKAGDREDRMAALRKAQESSGLRGLCKATLLIEGNEEKRDPFGLAAVYTCAGDKDQALIWLQRAIDERSFGVVWLDVDPTFDSLRSDTRFRNLMRRMNFSR